MTLQPLGFNVGRSIRECLEARKRILGIDSLYSLATSFDLKEKLKN